MIKGEYKTNVMRILDKHKINYCAYSYIDTGAISGEDVAKVLNQNPLQVFKTLVTIAKSGNYYVFMIPVDKSLDLKKSAIYLKEKNIEMLKQKDLLPLTGYLHGGCSPIAMKKLFPTIIDLSASNFNTIIFSAGKIGYQVELSLADLKKIINCQFADVIKD